jgi:hypothetical protein
MESTVDVEPSTFSPQESASEGSHEKASPSTGLAAEACSCIGEAWPCHCLRSDDHAGPATPHDALLRGSTENWQLAAFQINELPGALARVELTIPNYRSINVDTASTFADKLKAVNAAAKATDPAHFNAANGQLRDAHLSN